MDIIQVKDGKNRVTISVAEKGATGPQGPAGIGGSSVPATNTTLGGIIVGDNLSITGNGVLSAQPGGVTAFNNRTGNVSLTSNDVTSALTYTPLTTSTPYSNLSFTGTSAANPFTLKVQNANGSRYMTLFSGSSTGQNYADMQWAISNTRANGQTDVYYPFIRLYTDPLNPDINEGSLNLQYNYTANASTGPYFNTSIRISKTKAEFFAQTYTFTDNSLLTRVYADTRYQAVGSYLTSANLTFANLTGTPTTLAGYGITDGLTSANLTPYLTISSANATYSVLGHTHSIANVTGLQTALDLKLPSANFTYANITGTPDLTAYVRKTQNTTQTIASTASVGGDSSTLTLTSSSYAMTVNTLAGTSTLTVSPTLATLVLAGNATYTANSILTQGYADGRYLTTGNLTYANITGKPTLATVATSGSYTDLSNTPAAYSLPTATTSVLGGVKVDGSSIVINSGIISSTYSYTLPAATVSTLGGVRLGTGVGLDANGFLTTDVKLGANSFTGAQNLQDNELIRAKLRDYSESVSSPTISSGTLTLNLETSNIFTVSLNAAITTLTISNPPASGSGGSFTLIFTADGTARAVTWPAAIKWAGGTAPTITSTSGKVDSFAFFTSDGGTNWQGYVGGQNF